MKYKEILDFEKEILKSIKEIIQDENDRKISPAILLTKDIDIFMEERLQKRVTDEMNLAEKKGIIELELKNYIYSKLLSFEQLFFDENLSIYEFLGLLCDKIHNESIVDNITMYVVHLLSKLQGHDFYWYIEENTESFAPFMDVREGEIFGLVSHKVTYSMDIFATIWDFFMYEYEEKVEIKRS